MVEYYRTVLTGIFKLGTIFVCVKVASGLNYGMALFEMIRTFLADSIGVTGKGPDASVSGTRLSGGYKLEDACFLH